MDRETQRWGSDTLIVKSIEVCSRCLFFFLLDKHIVPRQLSTSEERRRPQLYVPSPFTGTSRSIRLLLPDEMCRYERTAEHDKLLLSIPYFLSIFHCHRSIHSFLSLHRILTWLQVFKLSLYFLISLFSLSLSACSKLTSKSWMKNNPEKRSEC